MDSTDIWNSYPRRLAEYFVVCGLPPEPKFYDYSKLIENNEEIIISNKAIDFTAFSDPIIDLEFISLTDENSLPPPGYHAIRHSREKKCHAYIRSQMGDKLYLCYRCGRNKAPITNISMFAQVPHQRLKPDAHMVHHSRDGKSAKLKMLPPTFLTYTRAHESSGIDLLAVIDICIIFPHKEETCPPAYIQLKEPLITDLTGSKGYLCFRKSLIKQHTIAYHPEVLFCYRIPPPPLSYDGDASLDIDRFDTNGDALQSTDLSSDPYISQVAEFCLPWGAVLESWSVDQDIPEMNNFSFVLTKETGERLYGVAVTFHEPFDPSQLDLYKCYHLGIEPELVFPSSSASDNALTPQPADELNPAEEAQITARQKHFIRSRVGGRVIGVTKAMCLLSRWPFHVGFANFLAFLYSQCMPGVNTNHVPLERYLTHFLCEVPFPTEANPFLLVELCAAPILLESPDIRKTSSSCEPFFYLLSVLGVELTINLFLQVLTEQKVLLTSVYHFLLTQIGEALSMMIFPLQWAGVYIPFIYMGHTQVIQSPSPFLIGVNSRFFDFFRLPPGCVTYVDLDTKNYIPAHIPGKPVLEAKLLPRKPLNALRNKLNALFQQIQLLGSTRAKSRTGSLLRSLLAGPGDELAKEELNVLQNQTEIGAQVKDAFMHCMASLLRDYRYYLIPVMKANRDQLFDSATFLKDLGNDRSRPLYELLFDTQHWANFVRDRSYLSARDEELMKFDGLIASLSGVTGFSARNTRSSDSLHASSSASESFVDLIQDSAPVDLVKNARHIERPLWPIPETSVTACISTPAKPITTSYTLVPDQWNSTLLDRLASYSYRMQLRDSLDALADTRLPLDAPLTRNSSQSLNSECLLLNGQRRVKRMCVTDSPSSVASRSYGLTGLPTEYPLPVKSSVILRRSPLEVMESMNCPKATLESVDYLIGTIYSLWFVLLPGYLYSLGTPTSINDCLTEAFSMATRIWERKLQCPDQVIPHILLALIYQHRPPKISISQFLDRHPDWNATSTGLANHIYSAIEKERQDAERIQREFERHRPFANTQRRSASTSCMVAHDPMTSSTPVESDQSLCDPPPAISCADPARLFSHKRSNSSTTAAQRLPCVPKSETDSGLHLGVNANEELPPGILNGDETADAKTIDSTTDDTRSTEFEPVAVPPAPLASLDEDLTDFGYSTLQRPPSDHNGECMQPSVGDLNATENPSLEQTAVPSPVPPLEPVQKPPRSEWFEQRDTEFHPGAQNGTSALRSRRSTSDSDSHSSDTDAEEEESTNPRPQMWQRVPVRPEFHQESSLDSSSEFLGDTANNRPRGGSLNQLASALSSISKSEFTSKVLQYFRDFTSTSSPSSNPPSGARRATTTSVERLFPSTPNSSRVPRDMNRWHMRSSDAGLVDASPRVSVNEGSHGDGAVATNTNPGASESDSWSSWLYHRQHLWERLGGPLTEIASRALVPATTNTILSLSVKTRPPASDDPHTVSQLQLLLTTCTACPGCQHLFHDEDLLAAFTRDPNARGVVCAFCREHFDPMLTIRVRGSVSSRKMDHDIGGAADHGDGKPPRPPASPETNSAAATTTGVTPRILLQFKHPYLSPVALRNSLEAVIQRDGDDCLRATTLNPRQSLLYRDERLLWNLVWYIQRIGLPTHLLDVFPTWLMDLQAQVLSGLSDPSRVCSDQFLRLKLSPQLPVFISLRWDEFTPSRDPHPRALYKFWLRRKQDTKSEWMLVTGSPPVLSASNLNLDPVSADPIEATVARVADSVISADYYSALVALIRLRVATHCNQPLSTVIRDPTVSSGPDAKNGTAQSGVARRSSLYKELLFLSICILGRKLFDQVQFDNAYSKALLRLDTGNNSFVFPQDRLDSFASAYRQMLRPLRLN